MKFKGLLLILLFLGLVTDGYGADSATLKEELEAKVAQAKTAEDSISALYNLFDISQRKDQAEVLNKIYDVAKRSNNVTTRLDVLRHLTTHYSTNDSAMRELYAMASELPQSIDQHQTLMYIRITRIFNNSVNASEAERQVRLREILHEYSNKEHYSVDERILLLFSLCAYLSNTAEGDLLVKYTDELEQLINSSPNTSDPIRSQFYQNSAALFTNIGKHDKAVRATRELLKYTDNLQKEYEAQGRVYRKFHRARYGMYRRLLMNYPELTLAEVDSNYNRIVELTALEPELKKSFDTFRVPTIAWMMAHERYREAAPIIKESIDKLPETSQYRTFLISQLNIAARHTDDKALQLFAAQEYNKHLEEELKFKSEERFRELQVIYDLHKIREANQNLEIKNRETQIDAHKTVIAVSIVALIIVIIITLVTFLMYVRAKQMSVSALHANQSLEHERQVSQRHYDDLMRSRNELNKSNLQKADLINSLGHEMRTPLTAISDFTKLIVDASDDSKKPYLLHFAQIITHNVELLEAISRDILDISLLDGDDITVSRKMTGASEMCEMVVETLRQTTHSGVEMRFVAPEVPASIITDSQRVEQILINLLKNSVRFTHRGEITLTYKVDRQRGKIRFIVTDTGCGVSEELQKTIFSRVPKGEHHSGTGIGLYLCQIIARRLDGAVSLDTAYTDGARFILTLPL